MIILKILVLFVVCYLLAKGFTKQETDKLQEVRKEVETEKSLVSEAYVIMKRDRLKLGATIRELREELQKTRWALEKERKRR